MEGKDKYTKECRKRVKTYFNMDTQYMEYFKLYNQPTYRGTSGLVPTKLISPKRMLIS